MRLKASLREHEFEHTLSQVVYQVDTKEGRAQQDSKNTRFHLLSHNNKKEKIVDICPPIKQHKLENPIPFDRRKPYQYAPSNASIPTVRPPYRPRKRLETHRMIHYSCS